MASKTRKRKQSVFSLSDEPIQQISNTTRRAPRSKRVSKEDIQQNPIEFSSLEDHEIVDYNVHTSVFEQTIPRNTNQSMNENNEEDNEDNTSDKNEKKTRGPTLMLEIWGRSSIMPRIKIDFDIYGRPIGTNSTKFSEFLGTVARNGMYCPLDVEDWHKMPNEFKKKMLHVVKSRFDISRKDEAWVLASINKKWRNWKCTQKARYFIQDMNVELLIDDKDDRVLQDQWINLLNFWNKEEVKARSQKNKVARSKKVMNHLTGKTSFAQIHENWAKDKGRAPSRAELLDACYANDKNTSPIVSKYLEEIEERRMELPEGFEDPVGPNDLFAQVRGQDRPGRVRMFGEGVSPSDVWGEIPNRNTSKRVMLEQQSEILKMKDQIAMLESQLLTQQSVTSQATKGSTSLSNTFRRPTYAKQTLRVGDYVAVRSSTDKTIIVGMGHIHSIGPNAELELEKNWCQIHVNVVLQDDEKLIRPRDFYEVLGDVLGEMVVWPCNLVTPTKHS